MMRNGLVLGICGRFAPVLLLFIGLLMGFAGVSQAATLTVTSPADSGTGSLRDAVSVASPGDTIDLNNQSITLTSIVITLNKNLTIKGPGTISGGGTTQIFSISSGFTVTLEDLTLDNGYTTDRGGAIFNNGTLTINRSTLSNNKAALSGGAIRNFGTLTITDSAFYSNTAYDGGGGALVNTGTATIQNVVASFNECKFTTFATAADGGAFYNAGSGTMNVIASTISGNISVWGGGGIANDSSGTLKILNSTLSGNRANNTGGIGHGGGGLFNRNGSVQVLNSTLSGNTTPNTGGGVDNYASVTLTNSTLTGNIATVSGGGIYTEGTVIVGNTLIAGNTPNEIRVSLTGPGTLDSQGYNLVPPSGISNGGTSDYPQTGDISPAISIDSIIKTLLVNNGGPTKTHALVTSSPAIDAGNNLLASTAGLTTDQSGAARIVSSTVDIGAVEYRTYPLTVTLTGTGSGSVADGASLNCPGVCTVNIPLGATVALTATPGVGANFAGWSGGSCTGAGQCIFMMSADQTVSAAFHIPTTMTVLSSADNVAGSLREQIAAAGPGDTIQFDSSLNGQTITLSGHIAIDKDLTIQGPGSGQLIINGNDVDKIFWINNSSATVVIDGLTLTRGSHNSGGAIDNWTGGGGDLTLKNCVLTGNSSSVIGGAIANGNKLTIDKCQLDSNDAYSDGGAIYSSGSLLNIKNSTLSGNSASINNGGAISSSSGTVTIIQSTLSGNTAGAFGGGLFSNSPVTIKQSTITNNSASFGGGIYQGGETLTLGNTLVAGNTATSTPATPEIDVTGGTFTSEGHNLFGQNDVDGLSGAIPNTSLGDIKPGPGVFIGNIINDLASNGGTTETHLLVAGSPAIDAGNNSLIPGEVTTDQRGTGFPRIVNSTVDIGAVEASAVTSFVVTNLTDSGPGSLRQVVFDANFVVGPNAITFQTGLTGTIALTTGPLFITGDLTIQGPGAGILTIDGGGSPSGSQIFTVNSASTVVIDGLTLQRGYSLQGGAIFNQGNLTISNSALINNSAGYGGAIQNENSGVATLDIVNSTLSGNSADYGGAIYSVETLEITNTTLSSNTSAIAGGAIYSGGVLDVTNSTLSGNSSATGGGIAGGGPITIINSTVVSNSASIGGGGIYYVSLSDSLQLANSLVAGNTTDEIFINSGATLNSLGHNLFGISGNNGIAGTGFINLTSDITPSVALDAIVAPLASNGGPTQTRALITGSPAINAGDNLQVTAAGLTTDQRGPGFLRIQPVNSTVDIGAYEVQIVNPVNVLTLLTDGTGSGTVSGGGNYAAGATVILSATPATGSTFTGWKPLPCAASFTMPANALTCTATFTPTTNPACGAAAGQTFTSPPSNDLCLTGTPSAVTSNPGTFDWSCTGTSGGPPVSCSAMRGFTVTATASPDGAIRPASQVIREGQRARLNIKPRKGYIATVSGCAGALTGNLYTTGPISADCEVTAIFGNEPYPLSVTTSAGGKVISDPAGIDCGADCRQTYVQGASVTLTAIPDSGALFTVWSGACVGVNLVCTVSMSAAKNAVATFESIADTLQRLTVARIGIGSGRIASTPPGIDCGTDCHEDYRSGTVVELTAVADAGSTFGGWLGACSGQGSCEVTMDRTRAVTATFNQ